MWSNTIKKQQFNKLWILYLWFRSGSKYSCSIDDLWAQWFYLSSGHSHHFYSFLIVRHWTCQVGHLFELFRLNSWKCHLCQCRFATLPWIDIIKIILCKLTSTNLLACSVNTCAYSSTSFSLPLFAASISTNKGTFVSKKLSLTWSTTALRNCMNFK